MKNLYKAVYLSLSLLLITGLLACSFFTKGPTVQRSGQFFQTAYVGVNSNNFDNVACFQVAQQASFNFGCIFAANIALDSATQKPTLYFNPEVSCVLNDTNQIKSIQASGTKVLLSVLNHHQNAGWSCFTDYTAAKDMASQLASVVQQYGLDGIDIDDEYSTCTPNDSSLIMITTALKQLMPDKIISKALFTDINYFQATWQNHTLAENLDYGWEMSYWETNGSTRLQPYVNAGMKKSQLAMGVSQANTTDTKTLTEFVKNNNFGGMMIWNLTSSSQPYLSTVSNALYNAPTTTLPSCLVDTICIGSDLNL